MIVAASTNSTGPGDHSRPTEDPSNQPLTPAPLGASAGGQLATVGPDRASAWHQNDTSPSLGDTPSPDPVDQACALTEGLGTRECGDFRRRWFSRYRSVAIPLAHAYRRIARANGYAEANRWLLTVSEELRPGRFTVVASTDVLTTRAKRLAALCEARRRGAGSSPAWRAGKSYLDHHGISYLLRGKANELLEVQRMCDARWWERLLVRLRDQVVEQTHRRYGCVRQHRSTPLYCSDYAFRRHCSRQARSHQYLQETFIALPDGTQKSLLEIYQHTVANPEIRRTELMVRLRGIEEFSKDHGHLGIFITITTPQRFHPWSAKGKANHRYKGHTPKDAQDWLNDNWKRLRLTVPQWTESRSNGAVHVSQNPLRSKRSLQY